MQSVSRGCGVRFQVHSPPQAIRSNWDITAADSEIGNLFTSLHIFLLFTTKPLFVCPQFAFYSPLFSSLFASFRWLFCSASTETPVKDTPAFGAFERTTFVSSNNSNYTTIFSASSRHSPLSTAVRHNYSLSSLCKLRCIHWILFNARSAVKEGLATFTAFVVVADKQ